MLVKSIITALLFLLTFLVHSQARVLTSTDSMWSIHTADSLLKEGDIGLKEYSKEIEAKNKYGVRIRKGEYYNYFPLGSSILAIPFVYLYENYPGTIKFLIPRIWDVEERLGSYPKISQVSLLMERLIACFYVAMATSLLFIILTNLVSNPVALSFALIFSFASPALSIASRGLWQHGPNMFMLMIGILCLLNSRRFVRAFSAVPFGFAYVVRPTSGLAFVLAAAALLVRDRKTLLPYLVLLAATLTPFFLFNLDYFGSIVPPYYKASRLTFGVTTVDALGANLFSFSRGLLVFCPYFLFGLLPLWYWKRVTVEKIIQTPAYILFILAYVPAHWLAVSAFPNWWGGHAFGPRYMSDTVPLLLILLAWAYSLTPTEKMRRAMLVGILVTSVVMVKVHWYGANEQAAWNWNVNPKNIDYVPDRVWEFRGSQFLRGLLF